MNVQVFSDLHFDINEECEEANIKKSFIEDEAILPTTDIICFVGDIFNNGKQTVDWIHDVLGPLMLPHQKIFYIFGNHEYYDCDMLSAQTYALSRNHDTITYLTHDQCIELSDDVCIIGDTMWTDFELNCDKFVGMMVAKGSMSDFRYIKVDDKEYFLPQDALKIFEDTIASFKKHIDNNPNKFFICLTHHAPSTECISSRYFGRLINCAYASELLTRHDFSKILLWMHGHMHHTIHKEIMGTLVVCNPFGYMKWYGGHLENDFFNYEKIINVDKLITKYYEPKEENDVEYDD